MAPKLSSYYIHVAHLCLGNKILSWHSNPFIAPLLTRQKDLIDILATEFFQENYLPWCGLW